MNGKSENRRRALRSVGKALVSLCVVLPLPLSATCAVGCGDTMSVGSSGLTSCDLDESCVRNTIKVPSEPGGTPAHATRPLAATWTRPAAAASMVRASDGGLWLASVRDATMVLVHLSEQGDLSGETSIAGAPPVAGTRVLGDIRALTEHASGPVATVEWSFFSLTGEPCNDHYIAYGDSRGVQCAAKLAETLLFDSAQLATPTRLLTCATKNNGYCYPVTAIRSRDGQSLLTATMGSHVYVQDLVAGRQDTMELPQRVSALAGVATDAASWLLYASNGSSYGYGRRDLVTIDGAAVASVSELDGADSTSEDSGFGRVFAGPAPQQTIVVFEVGPKGPGGVRQEPQATRDITEAQVPRDITVLRMNGASVATQQTLARQGFSELRLEHAGVDDAGNVYITTASGDRAAVVANALTPLLCRLPAAGEGGCVQLPARATDMQVSHSGVVFARVGDDIARFDFPL